MTFQLNSSLMNQRTNLRAFQSISIKHHFKSQSIRRLVLKFHLEIQIVYGIKFSLQKNSYNLIRYFQILYSSHQIPPPNTCHQIHLIITNLAGFLTFYSQNITRSPAVSRVYSVFRFGFHLAILFLLSTDVKQTNSLKVIEL